MGLKKFLGCIVAASFIGVCLGGMSFGAADIPALKNAKDPAERARIEKMIEAARPEGKLTIDHTMIEPKMMQYILQGFKEY